MVKLNIATGVRQCGCATQHIGEVEVCVLRQGRLAQSVEQPPMTYDRSESWAGDREFESTIFQITFTSNTDFRFRRH